LTSGWDDRTDKRDFRWPLHVWSPSFASSWLAARAPGQSLSGVRSVSTGGLMIVWCGDAISLACLDGLLTLLSLSLVQTSHPSPSLATMAFTDGIVLKIINVVVFALNFGECPCLFASSSSGGPRDLGFLACPPVALAHLRRTQSRPLRLTRLPLSPARVFRIQCVLVHWNVRQGVYPLLSVDQGDGGDRSESTS
jgi:hypothetical protein